MVEMTTNFGLNEKLRYYEVALDSLDNSGSQGTQHSALNWPRFFLGGKAPFKNIAAVKVLEVQIPFSYYVFVEANRRFDLLEFGQPRVTVTLPIGNYTITEMVTNLTTALNLVGVNTYVVTYDQNTQKLSFRNSSILDEPFSFDFGTPLDSGNITPRLYLGFPPDETQSQTFISGPGNNLEAPGAALVTGPNYIYVNSLKLGQLCNMYLPKGAVNLGGGNAGPQMAKVPVNVQPGGIIYWQDPGLFD